MSTENVPVQRSIDFERGWRMARTEIREAERQKEMSQRTEDVIAGAVDPSRDAKGRPIPEVMSDRELMIETLIHLRTMMDIFEGLGNHPMAASLGMAFPSNTRAKR